MDNFLWSGRRAALLACLLAIASLPGQAQSGAEAAASRVQPAVLPGGQPAQAETPALRPPLPGGSAAPASSAAPAVPASEPASGNQDFVVNPGKAQPLVGTSEMPLKGVARLVTAQARQLAICPLAKCRDKEMKFVEVTFKNSSSDIAVVIGDKALADVDSQDLRALPLGPIRQTSRPGLGLAGRTAVMAVAAGTFGFGAPMFYELITPGQHRKRSLGTGIGEDGSRHTIEASVFGTRVIMPGDETVGWMAFRCPSADSVVKKLQLPVSFTHSYVPDGYLVVSVLPPK